jgi:sialic acid synthase SpsE
MGYIRPILCRLDKDPSLDYRIIATNIIPKGIASDIVWTKRECTVIPAKCLEQVIAKVTKTDIPTDRLIRWDEIADQL